MRKPIIVESVRYCRRCFFEDLEVSQLGPMTAEDDIGIGANQCSRCGEDHRSSCSNCTRPTKQGAKLCPACQQSYRNSAKKRTSKRMAKGLCLMCGTTKARKNRTTCESCKDYARNYARRKRQEKASPR